MNPKTVTQKYSKSQMVQMTGALIKKNFRNADGRRPTKKQLIKMRREMMHRLKVEQKQNDQTGLNSNVA